MGKWLDRVRGDSSLSLLSYQAARERKTPEYHPDKTDKKGYVGFVGSASTHSQKKEGPAKVWKVEIDGRAITVIDPERLDLDEMRRSLVQKFGPARVGSIEEGGR